MSRVGASASKDWACSQATGMLCPPVMSLDNLDILNLILPNFYSFSVVDKFLIQFLLYVGGVVANHLRSIFHRHYPDIFNYTYLILLVGEGVHTCLLLVIQNALVPLRMARHHFLCASIIAS
jgi:hypothetical protein